MAVPRYRTSNPWRPARTAALWLLGLFTLLTGSSLMKRECGLRVLREVVGAVGGLLMKTSKDSGVRVIVENLAVRESKQVRGQTVLVICRISHDMPRSP